MSVASSLAADLLAYLQTQGIDAGAVSARAGIALRTGEDAPDRVPAAVMAALWREAVAASGDPDLGLHTGESFQPGALDIVGYVMLSSHTASEAIRRGARLMRLLNDSLAVDLEHTAIATRCRVRLLQTAGEDLRVDSRQVIETLLAGLVHQLRLLTGRAVIPLAVQMRHARPNTGTREHARIFGIEPTFDADVDAIDIDHRDLDVPLRSANPQLLAAFESHAEAALDALRTRESLSARVLHEIVTQLKGEAPSIPLVAKSLAMSARHLQRGLANEGTTFQSLLDDARRELAVRHLSAPGATVAKVAWLVGFSEPSAFHRAFRRWTGHSPRELARR
ncbi:AraC family transcriptional regulator [Gemmatimonas groenlandica]|uniref:AraC family transcriptional regulator n=1 Tax=Gemmatimonas groenlandica TaxID=2732249 RepID=A0A6M4IPX5_9BACT|nr:AraC family transcriptional regulator [Gemmatimonas groenlandica]QJR35557.1 AraC family transcriptional regulator [Gemmatimonas groenlandica]